MQLWTWQEPGFSLMFGYVDHTQSKYYNTLAGAPEAYAELATRLDTDQIIWCFVRPDDYSDMSHLTRVEWTLDVPDNEILKIIDAYIWNKILGIQTYPHTLRLQWLDDAPIEENARDAYIDQKIQDYHSQPEPDGGWWSRLFIKDTMVEGAEVLLKHPIPQSWVVCDGTGAA